MPLRRAGVEVRWDEGIRNLREMEESQASSKGGIGLSLECADYRGVPMEEAIEGVKEEAQLLVDIADAGWDTDEAEAVVEESIESMGHTGPLDPGVASLVPAISALGGTPISSCNGSLVGVSSHRSEVPHILFTAPPDVMDRIIPTAMAGEVGLIFNEGYAEAFADYLPNLHRLARSILELPPSPLCQWLAASIGQHHKSSKPV